MKTKQVKNVQKELAALDGLVAQDKIDNFQDRFPEFGGGLADGILKFDASGNGVIKVDASVDGILKFDASGNCILEVSASGNQ